MWQRWVFRWIDVPKLPLPAWQVLAADAFSAVGTGLTLPFLLVYLHDVRGLTLSLSGIVAACMGLAGLAGNALGGWLSDRFGPRAPLLLGLALSAVAAIGWAFVGTAIHAFAAAAVAGLGVSISWPSQSALLMQLVPAAHRSGVLATGNVTLNAGIGCGGLLAALIVDTSRPVTFLVIYLVDAGTFLVAFCIVSRARIPVSQVPPFEVPGQTIQALRIRGGYAKVARDRVLVGIWLLTAVLATVGFGQFNAALPILATQYASLRVGDLGLVFAANTAGVVVFQLMVLRMLGGSRRTRAAAVLGPLWAVCWVLVLLSSVADGRAILLATFVAAALFFALGETLLWPTLPAIVNDIAPNALRGRYNGAFTLALTAGFVSGPLLAGVVLGRGLAVPFLIVLTIVCASSAAAALLLERIIPPSANLIPVGNFKPIHNSAEEAAPSA